MVPPDPDATTTDGGGDGQETLLWLALMLASEEDKLRRITEEQLADFIASLEDHAA